jgi:hypothetical protein
MGWSGLAVLPVVGFGPILSYSLEGWSQVGVTVALAMVIGWGSGMMVAEIRRMIRVESPPRGPAQR